MMLYFPIFPWSFVQMCASLMYLIIFFFFFRSLNCLFIIYSLPTRYESLYHPSSIFLGSKVTQLQVSGMKVIISLWLASKSNCEEFYSSHSVHSPLVFYIYHYQIHGFEGPRAQGSYCVSFSFIKFIMLERKGISYEVIIYGRSRDPESKTVESFNSTIG